MISKNNKFIRQSIKSTSKFRTKNWIEKIINQEEHIIPIVTLDLKLQC